MPEEPRGGECGSQFPSNSDVAGGYNIERTGYSCDSKYSTNREDKTLAGNIALYCGTHRDARNDTTSNAFASQGNVIKKADITTLLSKIRGELTTIGRSSSGTLPSSIGDEIKTSDFQKMGDAIKANTGASFSFGSDPFNIQSSEVLKLVNNYNTLTNECVCHSDCGANITCTCHNDCGCHY